MVTPMNRDDTNASAADLQEGLPADQAAALRADLARRMAIDVEALRQNTLPLIGSPQEGRLPRDRRPMDILVLEDDESTRRLLQVALTQLGHQVIASSCFKDATTLLRTFVFDLLLCDINLPDGSGLDVLKEVPPGTGIHSIVLSGLNDQEDVQRSLAAGFDDHLVKPIDLVLLQRAVWKATGQTL